MITDVVAARTGTDATTDVYPHLRDRGGDLGDRHRLPVRAARQSGPAGPRVTLHECFALLRAGLERTEAVST